jgi:hypothetical protein
MPSAIWERALLCVQRNKTRTGLPEGRVQSFPAREVELPEPVDVQAVVQFSPVGNAAMFPHEPIGAQFLQVIGNEVLRLVNALHQLCDAQIAAGQKLQDLPAQVVTDQLQKIEGRREQGSLVHKSSNLYCINLY